MRQTTLCVPLEVKPASCSRLSALIEQLKLKSDGERDENFQLLRDQVPVLHFMSMSVFPAAHYDPLFILEANFDGAPGPFWGQLEAALGEELRGIIRCCKKPLTQDSALYDAVTRPGSGVPVARYLEARTQKPSVFHHGNRGLSRDQILKDHKLFVAIKKELANPSVPADGTSPTNYRGGTEQDAHRLLRERMEGQFPWLNDTAPVRIGKREKAADLARLIFFAVCALLALSTPGLVLALIFGEDRSYWLILGLVTVLVWAALYLNRKAISGTEVINRRAIPVVKLLALLAAGAIAYLVLTLLIVSPLLVGLHNSSWLTSMLGMTAHRTLAGLFLGAARVLLLGLASALLFVLPLFVLILRFSEMRDSSHDAPPIDEGVLREIVRREDWITQNHMGSIVLIKPGVLRSILIRAGHCGLGLFLRVKAIDGYLGSMRTVHFAHWAFLNNGSRLLFFSNFDHSWGSYLDDFIEKAHSGLTLAWGCGVGFPPSRFLVLDGASHGRQFKAWALSSRAVSRFWYSAYRELTVDQIERNHRIANGLRTSAPALKEAEAWAMDL